LRLIDQVKLDKVPVNLTLSFVMALAGATALGVLFYGKLLIGGSLFVALMIVVAAALSGNARLFFLMGLILSLPLDLSKYFKPYPHFGGEWAIRIEASDLFLVVLLGYWLVEVIGKKRKPFRFPAEAFFFVVLLVSSLLLAYFSMYKTLAFYEIIRMVKVGLLYLLLVNTVRSKSQLRVVILALLAGALLQCIYGLMQYSGISFGLERLGESGISATELIGRETASRVGAMLGHPNMFASYLVMLLPFSLTLLFVPGPFLQRSLAGAVMVTGSVALVLTLSRGGWIGFAFGVVAVYFMATVLRRLRLKGIGIRVALLVMLGSVGFAFFGKIMDKFTLSDPGSVSSRWELMEIAYKMIKENPWFGVGLNAFTFVMEDYDQSGIVWGKMLPPVHNIYLLLWSEQGSLVFAAIVLLLLTVLVSSFRNLRCRDPYLLAANVGLGIGFLSVLIQALADWTLKANTVQRVFWTFAALIAVIRYLCKEEELASAVQSASREEPS